MLVGLEGITALFFFWGGGSPMFCFSSLSVGFPLLFIAQGQMIAIYRNNWELRSNPVCSDPAPNVPTEKGHQILNTSFLLSHSIRTTSWQHLPDSRLTRKPTNSRGDCSSARCITSSSPVNTPVKTLASLTSVSRRFWLRFASEYWRKSTSLKCR